MEQPNKAPVILTIQRRVKTTTLPLCGEVRFQIMTGTQRDEYMTAQLTVRKNLMEAAGVKSEAFDAMSPEEQKKLLNNALSNSPELLAQFNSQQYKLISWCVVGPDLAPVWHDAKSAAASLDYEQSTELASACEQVNKLTPEVLKEKQLDFFADQRPETGIV